MSVSPHHAYASWAAPIPQSGWVMRKYEEPIPISSAERTGRLLTALAVLGVTATARPAWSARR